MLTLALEALNLSKIVVSQVILSPGFYLANN